MTKAEKLEALIDKARENGWSKQDAWEVKENEKGFLKCIQLPYNAAAEYEFDFEHIIFNHDFARALFGEGVSQDVVQQPSHSGFEWQLQLQQAVINDDPIGYMYGVVFDV